MAQNEGGILAANRRHARARSRSGRAYRFSAAFRAHSLPQVELRRELGLRDVILLYAIAVVSLQWLSTSALLGPGSLALWLCAVLGFFIPSGLAVMEMHSRCPGEGGLYIWVKEAFGDVHAFITGWCYVVSNFVFFP